MLNLNTLKLINWKDFSIRDVLKGCSEAYFEDYLKRGEKHKSIVKYRLKICGECPIYNNGSCDPTQTIMNVSTGREVKGCGCSIKCKTALLTSECPASKWLAVKEV